MIRSHCRCTHRSRTPPHNRDRCAWPSAVPRRRSRLVALTHPSVQLSLFDLSSQDSLRQWRSADVPQTKAQHALRSECGQIGRHGRGWRQMREERWATAAAAAASGHSESQCTAQHARQCNDSICTDQLTCERVQHAQTRWRSALTGLAGNSGTKKREQWSDSNASLCTSVESSFHRMSLITMCSLIDLICVSVVVVCVAVCEC